jgi:hypothetical protein
MRILQVVNEETDTLSDGFYMCVFANMTKSKNCCLVTSANNSQLLENS